MLLTRNFAEHSKPKPCCGLLLANSGELVHLYQKALEEQNDGCEGSMKSSPSYVGKIGKGISDECEGLTSNCEAW